ncbi:MAG: rhodanese-like domain-containing protein [Polaribacter sp.]|uniref:rhodanese-like domain-containing protein n=1 Tax=Polaribacter sp. TaxID=1920175 RepID=UPI003BB095BD
MKKVFCLIIISFLFINCDEAQEIKTITTLELKALLEKDKIQLLDVRTPEEIKNGFITSAKFVNYFDADFAEKVMKNLDKKKPVYLYCRSGGRSGKSAKILQEKGFEVYNVLGGFNQWELEN